MPRETLSLAILFADIAKSTHLYEKHGDKFAKSIIGSCLDKFAKITTLYHGTVIKTIGDEIMCTFPSADDAISAGKEMHEVLEQMTFPDHPEFSPPNLYVGIHFGPVIRESGDVFGDAVNVAARMVSQAKQRQLITTQETVNNLPPDHLFEIQCIDKTTIKGKSGQLNIYEVIWEQHDVTVMIDDGFEAQNLKCRLELKFHDQTVEVDENKPSVTLGRQSHNDLVVNDNRVSRSHSRIEYRRGKFVLIDQSSNGTFMLLQGKKKISLKRDEAQMLGDGFISLGREVDPDAPTSIHFAIKF